MTGFASGEAHTLRSNFKKGSSNVFTILANLCSPPKPSTGTLFYSCPSTLLAFKDDEKRGGVCSFVTFSGLSIPLYPSWALFCDNH